MKKLLALILAAALALSLVACGGGSGAGDTNTPSTGNEDTTSTDAPDGGEDSNSTEKAQYYKVGDTVSTDKAEFVLQRFEFAELIRWGERPMDTIVADGKKVQVANGAPPEYYLIPTTMEELEAIKDEDPVWRTPTDGKAFASISFTMKNVGSTKLKTGVIDCIVELQYDKYLFREDDIAFFDDCSDEYATNGRRYLELDVLEEAHECRGYIQVPEIVMTDTDTPLFLNAYLSNESGEEVVFTYQLR